MSIEDRFLEMRYAEYEDEMIQRQRDLYYEEQEADKQLLKDLEAIPEGGERKENILQSDWVRSYSDC